MRSRERKRQKKRGDLFFPGLRDIALTFLWSYIKKKHKVRPMVITLPLILWDAILFFLALPELQRNVHPWCIDGSRRSWIKLPDILYPKHTTI